MRGRHQHVRGDEPSRTPLIRLHWQLLSCGPTCSAEDPRTRPARKLHPGRNKINDSRFGANDGKEDDQSRILLDHLSDRDTNPITIKMGNRISALLIKQDLKREKVGPEGVRAGGTCCTERMSRSRSIEGWSKRRNSAGEGDLRFFAPRWTLIRQMEWFERQWFQSLGC